MNFVLYCGSRRLGHPLLISTSVVLTTLLPLKSAIKPRLMSQVLTNIKKKYAEESLYKTSKYVSEDDLEQFCPCNVFQVPVNSQPVLKEVPKTHIQGVGYVYSL